MTQIGEAVQSSRIPWRSILSEISVFCKAYHRQLACFFSFFFLITLPDQCGLFDWNDFDPVRMWIYLSTFFVFLAFSYFFSVVFILWISDKNKNTTVTSFQKIIKSTYTLMLPLTVLSIRGALLFGLGLLLFIIPGIYFSFKYSLASFCLILEGWHDDVPPILRAEKIISKYRFGLVILVIFGIVEWAGLELFELTLKIFGIQLNYGFKFVMAILQATLSVFYYLFMTFTMRFILKHTDPSGSLDF